MNFKPLSDRVLIETAAKEEKTPGGIFIPEPNKEKPREGSVVAVGPGRVLENGKLKEVTLKIGQKILFGKYSGSEVDAGGKKYLLMKEDDVLGVLE